MIYRAIGIMSGSSLDGLDMVYAEFLENGGKWSYEIINADCYAYEPAWTERLTNATMLSALDYQLLHTAYGHYIGQQVNHFIDAHQLHYKVGLVASHGHTSFHLPGQLMTAQLGDGAAIAAETKLPVVSDLRSLDVALHGQGAPIVPIGERLLLESYKYFLNIGGIANISFNDNPYIAFDVCPANRVLNLLANEAGNEFDPGGSIARQGQIIEPLLAQLNQMPYYRQPFPKSLANSFGTETLYPLLKQSGAALPDLLRTYVEHIVIQTDAAIALLQKNADRQQLLVTGGGAFNTFLMERLTDTLLSKNVEVVVPDEKMVKYKEALVMALIGVLRWREENNVLSSVTGASMDHAGGALWMGQGGTSVFQ